MKFFLFGIVQGLTEFLPISSSGHLYLSQRLLALEANLLPFFVFLHLATLVAIVLYLWKQIWVSFLNKKVLVRILIITAVTAAGATGIDHFLKGFFGNKFFVPLCLLVNGLILLTTKNIIGGRQHQDITLKESLLLGVLQALAFLPGISRSGITIAGLLRMKFRAKEAFHFSFLIAIPVIVGVFCAKFSDLAQMDVSRSQMIVGFFAALISGLIALKILRVVLTKARFSSFGYYCVILAVISLFF
ncbi:MAG: undecaprenyl-diphosphate phosphatase [Candidatus Omnitrophota bacterium]|nr:MAG: undecaprenyl-diphosphate phosphatase [Candidatus Omnitrophota bacterium]